MTSRWIAAAAISGILVTASPALAQSPAPSQVAPSAPPADPSKPAPASPGAPADPNVSYPAANGNTYQSPLTGQPDPTEKFYKGYNRT